MCPADPLEPESPTPAERVFAAEVIEPRERGESPDLAAVERRHPDLRLALRALESNWQAARHREARVVTGDVECRFDGARLEEWCLHEGDLIADFEVIAPLGRGSFGQVYRALQLEGVRRQVALKLLADEDASAIERFQREILALGRLNHPSIAKVFSAGADSVNGVGVVRSYFTMEIIEGEPIDVFCDSRSLSIDERLELFSRACQAVSHAHREDVVHRDLKPSNLLVQTDVSPPLPKVIDFGLVRALGGASGIEQARATGGVGTLTHMAPEQAVGSRDVGVQADVYSLGVVLYELLTGRLPIEPSESTSTGEFLHRLRTVRPIAPSERVGKDPDSRQIASRRSAGPRELTRRLRGDLDAILARALEKSPGARYAFVAEFADDIERHRRDEPVVAARTSWVGRVARSVRRHRVGLAIAGAMIVLTAVPLLTWLREELEQRRVLALAGDRQEQLDEIALAAREGYAEWSELRATTPPWAPYWERQRELALWQELSPLTQRLEAEYSRTVDAIRHALAICEEPDRERARHLLAAAREAWEARSPSLLEIIEAVPPIFDEALRSELEGEAVWPRDEVLIRSDPAGAEIRCFRYRSVAGRDVPLPFDPALVETDPARGFLSEERLIVDRVWWRQGDADPKPPFETGDELLELAGQATRTRGDLARALRGLGLGQLVDVRIRRGDDRLELRWAAWATQRREELERSFAARAEEAPAADRLVLPSWQLRVSFEGASLDGDTAPVLARTEVQGSKLSLPWGSYLLVLRHPDRAEMRLPLRVAGRGEALSVSLPRREDVVPGFVPIPRGAVLAGGDPGAFQPFPQGEREVGAFSIARYEITRSEWLEFLNDALVVDALDGDGRRAEPLSASVRGLLGDRALQLVPTYGGKLLAQRRGGRWAFEEGSDLQSAVRHVSHLAAREYAQWRSLVAETRGRPWVFRLPTDEEWERAARGVDGRRFPWGSYPLWSACVSRRGRLVAQVPLRGLAPLDESPFGVRDLAGSVREHTSGLPVAHLRGFYTVRGGSYREATDEFFRLASRNTMFGLSWKPGLGVRLVAVPRTVDSAVSSPTAQGGDRKSVTPPGGVRPVGGKGTVAVPQDRNQEPSHAAHAPHRVQE